MDEDERASVAVEHSAHLTRQRLAVVAEEGRPVQVEEEKDAPVGVNLPLVARVRRDGQHRLIVEDLGDFGEQVGDLRRTGVMCRVQQPHRLVEGKVLARQLARKVEPHFELGRRDVSARTQCVLCDHLERDALVLLGAVPLDWPSTIEDEGGEILVGPRQVPGNTRALGQPALLPQLGDHTSQIPNTV